MKKRTFKRLATALLTGSMMVGMMGMSVCAESNDVLGGTTTFDKYLVIEDKANVPNATFNYTIKAGTAQDATANTPQILAGIGKPTITSTTFAPTDSAKDTVADGDIVTLSPSEKYVKKQATVNFTAVTFTAPGIYRYEINETNSGQDGFTYATNTLYLDVYVTSDDNGELGVGGYVIHKTAALPGTNGTFTDTNEKATGFINKYTTNNLTLKKIVAGNQADRDEYFSFTVKIDTNTSNAGNKYTVDLSKATSSSISYNGQSVSNVDVLTVGDNGKIEQTFYLKGGEEIIINGLTATTTYSIVENLSPNEEYETTIEASDDKDEATLTASGTMNADDSVTYTNTKTVSTPTGVILTFAPYILMVALAAVVAFFFLRRRNREF